MAICNCKSKVKIQSSKFKNQSQIQKLEIKYNCKSKFKNQNQINKSETK